MARGGTGAVVSIVAAAGVTRIGRDHHAQAASATASSMARRAVIRMTAYFRISTGVPASTASTSARTSQLVRRTQPLEAVLPTRAGSGVPWMP